MGFYTKALLFLFLKFSVIHGANSLCPASYCGTTAMLKIQYPFKLETQTPTPTNNCTYFNLSCNKTQSTTLLNLPHAGDFYVQNIDYGRGFIQLYDPGNCLATRLMINNFSLQSSPFYANRHENYTFYVCPMDISMSSYVIPIVCMTNSTNITLATDVLPPKNMEDYGCISIGSWLLPVPNDGNFDPTFFYLTWDARDCADCDDGSGKHGISKILAMAFSMPALILMALSCCSVFCLHLMKMVGMKYRDDLAAAAAMPITTIEQLPPIINNNPGLDDSKIMACTETVVLSENDEGVASDNTNTCSICLENYCKTESVRLISKCRHCFHDNCIQQWLGKNSSCPVCRTSLSDTVL